MWLVVRRQLAPQPCPGVGPIALYSSRGDALSLGNFFDGHARKHAQLDELRGFGIGRREFFERFVQVQELVVGGQVDAVAVAKLAMATRPALALAALAANALDENPPHRLRGVAEETTAVVPAPPRPPAA